MQKELDRIEEANIQVVGISYDQVSILQKFAEENSISIPLLSDTKEGETSHTIKAYQLFDQRESGRYRGVPVPTTVVIGQEKKVRLVLPGQIKKRHSINALIEKVSDLE